MRIPGFSGKRWTGRKIMIAVLASVGILAMVGTTLASVVMPLLASDQGQGAPRTTVAAPRSTTPALVIKPLAVRTVMDVPLKATPEDCPPVPPPTPPQEPVRVCDVEKVAVYQLAPVALQLNLTGATQTRLPTSEFHTVQMSMDSASSAAFAQYTAANIGKQLAFVRDGVVLAAPAISEPINGQSLQISGELTAATAETIARMLRDGT
jgi:preprotein translocase subunit SecD